MKSQLIAIVAAVLVVGCGPSVDIHDAAREGNIEAIKQAIADGADLEAKGGRHGWTPLLYVAAGGHKEIAELLIDKGADVNAKSTAGGSTPLHNAAHRGRKEIIELLIANGADVNAKNGNSQTPLDMAVRWGKTETADLLRKHGGKTNVLQVAARPSRQQRSESSNTSDKEKALELLFGTNSTITEKDEAFLSAAKKGKLDEVKSLLAEGVDVDCSDAFSCTGLFWAAANNHKSIVEFLIEKGANLNAGAGVGGTPLARAAYEGHVEVVELLIAKGADVNAKDVSGGSPLDSADESVVDLLRKHGAKEGN